MKKLILVLALICMIAIPVFAVGGTYTTNGYFYMPAFGAYGTAELNEYNTYMQIADTQIEANKTGIADIDLSLYYLKTEIDTQGEMETIWDVLLVNNGDLASYYLKTDINTQTKMETIWDVSLANDSELHNAVTIGTANGLSLSTQALSMALADTNTTGALSDTDWDTFNNKVGTESDSIVGAISGIVKADGAGNISAAVADTDYQSVIENNALTTNKLDVFASTTSAELAGVISDETGTGKVVLGTAPTFTTSIKTPIIYGTGSNYLKIGDAGGTSYGLNSEDDLLVTGDLEVAGELHTASKEGLSMHGITDESIMFSMKEEGGTGFRYYARFDFDSLLAIVGERVGRQFVLTDYANRELNHDHAIQTNPTLFVQSATSPNTDNTQWISFTHNQTDGKITTGKGDIILDPAGYDVAIDAPTDNDAGLKFTENSGLKWHIYNDHTDDNLQVYSGANLRYEFKTDGTANADVAWGTFSPVVKGKGKELLDIALEDANKPVKPYVGIPVVKIDDELFDVVKEEYEYKYQEYDDEGNEIYDKDGKIKMATAIGIKEVKIPRDRLPNEFKTQAEVDVEYEKYHKVPAKITIANAKYLEYLTGIIDTMQVKIDELEARIEKLEEPIEPIK